MSFVSKNKKFLNLDNLRVFYDKKENVIKLTSTDEDLAGKPFQITLKQGTESEATLRDLLIENEVITEEEVDPQYGIPKYAKYPQKKDDLSRWDEFPMGVSKNSVKININISTAPHALIGGSTGSGKSIIFRNYFLHTLRHKEAWSVFAIDLKRVEFSPYKKLPQVDSIATTHEEAFDMLRFLKKQLDKRYLDMENERVNHFLALKKPSKAIMLIIDEAALLLSQDGSKTEEGKRLNEEKVEMQSILGSLARLGRAAGIHVVVGTQRPDATIFPGELRANLDTKLAAGKMDSTPSMMVLGSSMATKIPGELKGRGVLKSHSIYDDSGLRLNELEIFIQIYYSSPDLIVEDMDFKNINDVE